MNTLEKNSPGSSSILYRGRALTAAEALGLAGGAQPLRYALPLLASGWLGLLLVVCNPIAGLATIVAAPLLWSSRARLRHA